MIGYQNNGKFLAICSFSNVMIQATTTTTPQLASLHGLPSNWANKCYKIGEKNARSLRAFGPWISKKSPKRLSGPLGPDCQDSLGPLGFGSINKG